MIRAVPPSAFRAGEAPLRSIAEVERATQVPRATLRMWERRYGFPSPTRDERGERCYSAEQVAQLQLMQQLIEQGHRPARLLAAGAAAMQGMAAAAQPDAVSTVSRAGQQLLALLRGHDGIALKRHLEARIERVGLAQFAGAEVPALNSVVGDAWATGQLEAHEEHLYSDCVYQVLRGAIAGLEDRLRPEAPQVMLTTLPQEHHGIGLLMAQSFFALEGCPTISLGVRLPVEQIVSGVSAYRADLVGLTFTAGLNPSQVVRSLEELRGLLPASVRIWAGGNCPVLYKRSIAGVRAVSDVRAIPHLLAEDFALPPQEPPVA